MEIKPANNPLKYYQELRDEMIANDKSRNEFFDQIDKLDKVQWELPQEMNQLEGIHKVTSPDGRDAIRTATRILSGTFPRIKWMPETNNEATKKQANQYERMLEIMLHNASKRNEVSIQRDVVKSACKYDMVAAQVTYIPYQMKVAKAYGYGGDAKHWENALRDGAFIVKFRQPMNVHIMRSDYGMTGVLYHTTQKLHKIMSYWGKDNFKSLIKDGAPANLFQPYDIFDYTDGEDRVVWVEGGKDPIEIMRCKHDLPFMGTWVAKAGGTNMDDDSKYVYEPLLASVVHSGQWETQNILETLAVSSEIWHAAKPDGIVKSPDGSNVEQDFTRMGNNIIVKAGQEYTVIPPSPSDVAKLQMADRIAERMNKSSVSPLMQSGQAPANTAFGTVNTMIGIASMIVRPHKALAEQALEGILTRMVEWVCQEKEPLVLQGMGQKIDIDDNDFGQEYILDPMFIDPQSVRITVELEPETTLDKQQKINAASTAVATLHYPIEQALEDVGVNDPRQAMKQWALEQIETTMIEAKKAEIMGEAQAKVQAMMADVQMRAQQAQMQAQGLQSQDFNPAGAQGDMNNPGMSGLPPAMSNPNQTFEDQTGMTRGGEEINVG